MDFLYLTGAIPLVRTHARPHTRTHTHSLTGKFVFTLPSTLSYSLTRSITTEASDIDTQKYTFRTFMASISYKHAYALTFVRAASQSGSASGKAPGGMAPRQTRERNRTTPQEWQEWAQRKENERLRRAIDGAKPVVDTAPPRIHLHLELKMKRVSAPA